MSIKPTNMKHGVCRKDLERKMKDYYLICSICEVTGHEKRDHKVDKKKLEAETCEMCKWMGKICIC